MSAVGAPRAPVILTGLHFEPGSERQHSRMRRRSCMHYSSFGLRQGIDVQIQWRLSEVAVG